VILSAALQLAAGIDAIDWDEATPEDSMRQESILRMTSAVYQYTDRLRILMEVGCDIFATFLPT